MKLKEIHFRAIDLMVAGQNNKSIAEQLNVAPETISRWRSDFDFQAELNARLKLHQAEAEQRLRSLADTALSTVESVMSSPSAPEKDRLTAAFKILEMVKLSAGSIGSDNAKVLARDAELEQSSAIPARLVSLGVSRDEKNMFRKLFCKDRSIYWLASNFQRELLSSH